MFGKNIDSPPPPAVREIVNWAADFWIITSISILSIFAFSRIFGSELVFDSSLIIGEDTRLALFSATSLRDIFVENYWWPSASSSLYRPLTTFLFNIQYSVLGFAKQPAGYQLINLLLHITAGAGTYFLLIKMECRRHAAFLVSALFAVHPYATEIIPNIVGLSDILAYLSIIGIMHIFLDLLQGRRKMLPALGLVLLIGIAGVLSKENAISIIALLIWYSLTLGHGQIKILWVTRKISWRHVSIFAATLVLISAVAILPKFHFVDVKAGPDTTVVDNPLRGATFVDARLNAFSLLGENLVDCIVPLSLSADYSYDQIKLAKFPPQDSHDVSVFVGAALTVAFGATGLILFRKKPALSFTIGACFIIAMPTANILILIGTIRADRLLYPLILPVLMCIVIVLDSIPQNVRIGKLLLPLRNIMTGGSYVMLLLFALLSNFRASEWRTPDVFWKSSLATAPDSFKTKIGWALICYRDRDNLAKIEEGIALSRIACDQLAQAPSPQINASVTPTETLANGLYLKTHLLIKKEQTQQAEEALRETEKLVTYLMDVKKVREKEYKASQFNMKKSGRITISTTNEAKVGAEILRYQNRHQEAVALLESCLDTNRFSIKYLKELARAKIDAEDWNGGMRHFLEALLLSPANTDMSREAAFVYKYRKLPLNAQAFPKTSEKMPVTAPLIDLDDPQITQLAQQALKELANDMDKRNWPLDKASLLRGARVRLGLSIENL